MKRSILILSLILLISLVSAAQYIDPTGVGHIDDKNELNNVLTMYFNLGFFIPQITATGPNIHGHQEIWTALSNLRDSIVDGGEAQFPSQQLPTVDPNIHGHPEMWDNLIGKLVSDKNIHSLEVEQGIPDFSSLGFDEYVSISYIYSPWTGNLHLHLA